MIFTAREKRAAQGSLAAVLALALAGCSIGGGPSATATATAAAAPESEIDIRRYLGPDYCPELRIREGTEILRRYEAGHEEEAAHVIWQASMGKTARECLYDTAGNLTLRVGLSGRVVAGPKGGQANADLPLRISVIKYKEKVLASQLFPLSVAMSGQNAAVFTQVHEMTVPSPGKDRDYLIYVGMDEKGENLLDPTQKPVAPVKKKPVVVKKPVVKKPQAPPAPVAQGAPPAPAQPKVLPVPSGFVLPDG